MPSDNKRFVPIPSGLSIRLGTAYRGLLFFKVKLAVDSAPLCSLASTMMSSVDQALIKAFLVIKCCRIGGVPGGCWEIKAPPQSRTWW